MKGTLNMSVKEANRITILDQLVKREIKQKKAAEILGLSVRQTRRLKKKYKVLGISGLIHGNRGKESNHKINNEEVEKVMQIVKRKYPDFGPTLAFEKLVEKKEITFSVEKLRQVMIGEGLWKVKRKRRLKVYQSRERREALGELVQIDGSPFGWFEGRADKTGTVTGHCSLLVFVDDATGKLLNLWFAPCESTNAYFEATKHYLSSWGKPLAFYADKHGIFRINTTKEGASAVLDSVGLTQFSRAMEELKIQLIFANSPQAKGRVEKVNGTLQDRLTKELRLKRINSIEEANKFLPEFMKTYNQKFSVVPKSSFNAHRPLLSRENLDEILIQKHQRILSKNLSFQYKNKLYQIKIERPSYTMKNAPVVVKEDTKGKITVDYKGKKLDYSVLEERPKMETVGRKEMEIKMREIKALVYSKPDVNHPWRRWQFR